MDFHYEDDPCEISSMESLVEKLRRQNYRLQLKLRKQTREVDELRAGGHSSGEERDLAQLPSDLVVIANGSHPAMPPGPATDKPSAEKLDPALIGMSTGLKHLYSGKEDRRGRFQWQTTIPQDVGRPAEDAETAKWALIVRNVKVYNDPKKVLAMHSIVVQSPHLKEFLKNVLAGYPGVTVGLDRLEFAGRFEPLIHRWKELKTAFDELSLVARTAPLTSSGNANPDDQQDEKGQQPGVVHSENAQRYEHVKLLHDLLSTEFQQDIDASTDMKSKGVMTYEHLWTLFEPGQMVYNRQEGQDRVFKLISGGKYGSDHDGNHVFWLSMQYIDYDGTRYGTQRLNVKMKQYSGTRTISSLSCFPLDYHKEKAELETRLIERATKIEALAGTHYKAYEGIGWRLNNVGGKDKFIVKGRIVIDTYGWNRFNPNMAIYVTALHVKDAITGSVQSESRDSLESEYHNDDDLEDGMPIDGHFEDEEEDRPLTPLTSEQKLICSHLFRGYALKEKIWLNFYVNSVKDITFNNRAFDSLVIPEKQKELILGFTASQQAYRNAFDDVIEGKGRGIVVLLSGPPGVGKTLTAESVAEEMKVPLYVMSAGDLGLESRQIESRLQNCFEMVTRWNAILLLDEADVFLEERSLHELERNKLVSIFLRVLEYYEGIMFLTTNRVNTFDAAFQSRIHISLDYAELSIDSRQAVWKNFLDQHNVVQSSMRAQGPSKTTASTAKSSTVPDDKPAVDGKSSDRDAGQAQTAHEQATQPHAITDAQILQLARTQMNGRQIKNILKTATLLATRRKEALKKEHITTVLDVTQHLHNASRETDRARSAIFN